MLTFKINGVDHVYDNEKLMFSEAMEIQKATGLDAKDYEVALSKGDMLAYGVMFWLTEARTLQAAAGCSFRDAVAQLPWATYDVNLHEAVGSIKRVVEPDPTGPTPEPEPADGSAESTSPGTSEPLPEAPPTPSDAGPTSEPSPSSSESAPGSGTA